MTNPEHDEVFEAYLKRRSVLPNALDDRLEPPAALDEIVLQRAQEAIKAQAGSDATQQTVRAPRWAMPVALAATVLLCLSVVLNISLNTNRPTPNLQRLAAARANVNPGAEADARGDGRGDGRTNNDGERRESMSGDVPSHEVVLTEAKVAGSPAPRAPVVADSALASRPTARAGAGAAGPASAAAPSAIASATAPTLTAAPAPPAFTSAKAPASAAAPAPSAFVSNTAPESSAAAPASPAPESADGSARSAAPSARRTRPPAAPAPTVLASAAGTAAAGTARQPSSADAESPQQPSSEEPRIAARSAADKAVLFAKRADASPPGSPPPAAGAVSAPTSSATAPHPADPKVWLQQIGALRAAGEKDQADAEMRRFRVVFPGYATNPAVPAASEPPK
jgi:hypothetical protein